MNEDQLSRSLEDLFSDVSLPEPEVSGDLEAQREEVARGHPDEGPPAAEREEVSLPLGEAPPSEPDAAPLADRGAQPKPRELETETPIPEMIPLRFADWRQELLQGSLYAALIIGLFVVGLACYRAYTSGIAILLPFYLVAYALLLLVTFWNEVSYNLQAASFLGLTYSLGFLNLVQFGPGGDGRILLLTLPVLAVVFFGQPEAAIALLISFVTQALFGWGVSTGRLLPLGQGAASVGQASWWWMEAVIFLLLAAGLAVVQNRLVPYLARTLDRSHKLAVDLADSRARVGAQKRTLRQRDLQLELVVELARIAASRLDIEGVLHRAVELIPAYLDCYLVSVFLLDESGEAVVLRAATGAVGAELEAEGLRLEVANTSIVGWTAEHRKPYVAAEVAADDLYRPHPALSGTMSEVAVPLKAEGFLLGVLDVQARSRDALGEIDVRVLRGVADQLAMAIQDARRTSNEVTLLEATSPLYRANRRLSTAATVDDVVQVVIDSVTETEADGCLIGALERSSAGQRGHLRYLGKWDRRTTSASPQVSDQRVRPGVALSLSESPLPVAMMERFWSVADVAHDDGPSDDVRRMLEGIDAKACVNVPLQVDGESVGHILVLCRKPRSFSERSMQLFDVLGEQAAAALMHAWQLEEAQRRAWQEELASKATARMHESLDLESVLSTAVRDIGEALGLAALDVRLGPAPVTLDEEDSAHGNGGGLPSQHGRGEEG